jgi:hypothetical protein
MSNRLYVTTPDRNANKQKLQLSMQPMQNNMAELNPDHHTRQYSNYESNFLSYPTTNTGKTKQFSQTAAGHISHLSLPSKNTFICAPTSPQPVPAVPQVSNCSNCSRLLKQIDLLERRVDALENKHDYQIRLESEEISQPKYPDFSRMSKSVNQKKPDVKAVPEVDEPLTPAEITQLDIWFPNRVVPKEALLVVDCHLPVPETDPCDSVIGRMTHNDCDKHDFQQIRPETDVTKPKYPEFLGLSSVQPVPNQKIPDTVPEFDDSLSPTEKALLRIWYPAQYQIPEQIMTVLPDVPNRDNPPAPASNWINPLGQKVPIPLPKPNQPTQNQKGIPINIPPAYWNDPPVLNDNFYQETEIPEQITTVLPDIPNQDNPCENKVIESAPRTPLPNSRPPTKWENPTFCNSTNNYNPYRMVKYQQPGPSIPALTPPYVHPNFKPLWPPAIWNPYGKGIPRNIPPAWNDPPVLNDNLTYQTKEIPDQQTAAQNVPEERNLPSSYDYCMNSSSQKSPKQPIPIKNQSKSKMPPNTHETWWKTISKWLPANKVKLPDDTNPVIIWDGKNGVWVDTSTNCPPPPDKSYNWKGAPLTMVCEEATGNWVDRKKYLCGANLGPGHHHQSQRKIQQLMLELAAKNTAQIESDISAGKLSQAKCREKFEAVRVMLSEAYKIPSLVDPASTEGVLQSMGRIQHWINL